MLTVQKAFNAWMVEGVEPTANPTERAEMVMKRNIDLMERVGIQSVPATFVADGRGPVRRNARKLINAQDDSPFNFQQIPVKQLASS